MAYIYVCIDLDPKGDLDPSILKRIKNFKRTLERQSGGNREQCIQMLESLSPVIYKKDLDRQRLKLIIQQVEVEEETFFCFRRIVSHGQEYHLLHNESARWIQDNPISGNDLQAMQTIIEEARNEELQMQSIPENLRGWLEPCVLELEAEVFESHDWIASISSDFKREWKTFYDILCGVIGLHSLMPYVTDQNVTDQSTGIRYRQLSEQNIQNIWLACKEKCYVIYKPISIDQYPQNRLVYFLYTHFYKTEPTQEQCQRILEKYPEFTDIHTILPYAQRAYSDWILADKQVWYDIEGIEWSSKQGLIDFDQANLALSGEEQEILKSAPLPLFINGQAGSGKSTMLLYLFAGYCMKRLDASEEQLAGKPLFLTYNERLLETAYKGILAILTRNPNYYGHGSVSPEKKEQIKKEVKNFMWPLQRFILNDLLSDEDRERFVDKENGSLKNHISFSEFKRLYENKNSNTALKSVPYCRLPERKDYSPDLVWHVIRTFIKGYSATSELSVNEYCAIPEADKSIDDEVYQKIYERIYGRWYKKLPKGYWDDIDLIRYTLRQLYHSPQHPRYPVIFCDEAQDFTRVEFELLIKISDFAGYNLSTESSVPFAFAGDPFQTLNPTGFSWLRLCADFYEKLKQLKLRNIHIVLRELKKNYRSTPNIVRLANFIQYYRYKLSEIMQDDDMQNVQPQDWWQQEDGSIPLKFIGDDNFIAEALSHIKNTTIIIPPDPGGEQEFIERDDLLRKAFENTANIFSPIGVKGLEFSTVVLYKFGDSLNDFKRLFADIVEQKQFDTSMYIRAAYFFNKLYVALTRSRKSVYVIDTEHGDGYLWKYLTEEAVGNLYHRSPEDWGQWPSKKVGTLSQGCEEQFKDMDRDPLDTAKEYAVQGRNEGKSDVLRRAAHFYRMANQETEARVCEAEAFQLDKEWDKAGVIWHDLQELDKASDCFWKGESWSRFIELYSNDAGIHNYRRRVAEFMRESTELFDVMKDTILDINLIERIFTRDSIPLSVVTKIKNISSAEWAKDRSDWTDIAYKVGHICDRGFNELSEWVARCFFKGEAWFKAIHYWEQAKATSSDDYYWAQAFAASPPQLKLKWLLKLRYGREYKGETVQQRIKIIWDNYQVVEDNEELIERIAFYFFNGEDWKQAIAFWDLISTKEEFGNIREFPWEPRITAKSSDHQRASASYCWAKYSLMESIDEQLRWLLPIRGYEGKVSKLRDRGENNLDGSILELWDKIKLPDEIKEEGEFRSKLSDVLKKNSRYADAYDLVVESQNNEDWKRVIELFEQDSERKSIPTGERFIFVSTIARYVQDVGRDLTTKQRDDLKKVLHEISNNLQELISDQLYTLIEAMEKTSRFLSKEEGKTAFYDNVLDAYQRIIERSDTPEAMVEWARSRKQNVEKKRDFAPWESLGKQDDMKDWRSLATELNRLIARDYPNELWQMLLERVIEGSNMTLIQMDWKTAREELIGIQDQKLQELVERIDQALNR